MSDAQLHERLKNLQEENGKLYERLSILRKKLRIGDDQPVSNASLELESAKQQLAEAEFNRAERKAILKCLTESHQSLKTALDSEMATVTIDLPHFLADKQSQFNIHLENLIKQAETLGIPDSSLIKHLIDDLRLKEKQIFVLEDEFLKIRRTIAAKSPTNYGSMDSLIEDDDFAEQDENPLPCIATSPVSLEHARTKRRKSFRTGESQDTTAQFL